MSNCARHACCQVAAEKMEIGHCRLRVAVSGVGGKLMQFPAQAREVSQPKMPQAMRAEVGYPASIDQDRTILLHDQIDKGAPTLRSDSDRKSGPGSRSRERIDVRCELRTKLIVAL